MSRKSLLAAGRDRRGFLTPLKISSKERIKSF